MKKHFDDLKVGDHVCDAWWPNVYGVITKKLKTRLWVKFTEQGDPWKYDVSHTQFLSKETQNGK
jgi:hypothetical protein